MRPADEDTARARSSAVHHPRKPPRLRNEARVPDIAVRTYLDATGSPRCTHVATVAWSTRAGVGAGVGGVRVRQLQSGSQDAPYVDENAGVVPLPDQNHKIVVVWTVRAYHYHGLLVASQFPGLLHHGLVLKIL